MQRQPYAPPVIVELGTLHERTLSWVIASDGQGFAGQMGLALGGSVVICPKRSTHALQEHPGIASDHVGFNLPNVV